MARRARSKSSPSSSRASIRVYRQRSRQARAARFGLAVGDVRIGDWDGRRVVAHARGTIALDPSGERIQVTTTLSQLTANCTSPMGGATLTPCLSDLMPTVREALLGRQVRADIPGGDLLSKLPSMSFGGARLQLTGLRATTNGSPVRLSLKVRAAVVGEVP